MRSCELVLLTQDKTTDNKVRWATEVEGVKFQFYVTQASVPEPWPQRIRVDLWQVSDRGPAINGPAGGLAAVLDRFSDHTRTVRYRPRGNPEDWLIGEPYIPYELLGEEPPPTLGITVEWL